MVKMLLIVFVFYEYVVFKNDFLMVCDLFLYKIRVFGNGLKLYMFILFI